MNRQIGHSSGMVTRKYSELNRLRVAAGYVVLAAVLTIYGAQV